MFIAPMVDLNHHRLPVCICLKAMMSLGHRHWRYDAVTNGDINQLNLSINRYMHSRSMPAFLFPKLTDCIYYHIKFNITSPVYAQGSPLVL